MIENFVLTGKAKTVFRLIELKTQRAQQAEREQGRFLCLFRPGERCSSPDSVTCASSGCSVWKQIDGE